MAFGERTQFVDSHSSARWPIDDNAFSTLVDVVLESKEGRDSMNHHTVIRRHRWEFVPLLTGQTISKVNLAIPNNSKDIFLPIFVDWSSLCIHEMCDWCSDLENNLALKGLIWGEIVDLSKQGLSVKLTYTGSLIKLIISDSRRIKVDLSERFLFSVMMMNSSRLVPVESV